MKIFNKIKTYVLAHKITSIVVLVILVLIGNWGYKKITSTAGDTRYVSTKVTKGTIVASVSGSGQVSASSQVEIKSKVSGDVNYIGVTNGQKVNAGTTIVNLNAKDAEKSVRDAEISLTSAKLSLEKLKIQNSTGNMTADTEKVYSDGFNSVSSTFLDMPSIMNGMENMLNNKEISDNATRLSGQKAQEYRNIAYTSFYKAKDSLNNINSTFVLLNQNSKKADIENIINETYKTTKLIAETITDLSNLVSYMSSDTGQTSNFTSDQNTLTSYSSTTNAHSTSLLGSQTSIRNNKDSFQNSNLDIQSNELAVKQKENSLQDAKDNLADYYIRAPYEGTITGISLQKADSVSSGTTVATLITNKQFAGISLNEVDVARIKTGQKATLTFDAIPDLTISGIVSEIDSIGTVSQGVVTYNVKISFDTQDERIKPSMSVSAEIITDVKQDVLAVPNSAIKSQNGSSYVEHFTTPLAPPTDGLSGSVSKIVPEKIPVEVGLSNNSETEIISGLKEGDEIVTRTILPSATKTASAAPSIFGATGGGTRAPSGGTGR